MFAKTFFKELSRFEKMKNFSASTTVNVESFDMEMVRHLHQTTISSAMRKKLRNTYIKNKMIIKRIDLAHLCFRNSMTILGLEQKDETTFLDFGIYQAVLCIELKMIKMVYEL
jgi:hypothetical protein